mgnify:CR=1 FL=1
MSYGISVIIPAYDRAHVLCRCLDSVLEQTLEPDEIIVVDDGSTDQTAKLIADRYPQITYLHQANQGVSKARNYGVARSIGDWLAFLDSDDEWLPGKLQQQMTALQQQPDYQLCHTEEIWIRNGRRVNPMNKHAKSGGHIFENCLPLCAISPSSVIIKRDLFDQVGGFDEQLPACEDYDLWLRICARNPVIFLEQPLIRKYGGHADQLSRKYWGLDRFRISALEKILQSGLLTKQQIEAATDILLQKCEILTNGAAKRGNKERAAYYSAKLASYRSPSSGQLNP